jgi:hypothetical protein
MIQFTPRGPYCVIRVSHIDKNAAGIALSQTSADAKQYHVESIGPDVENLKIGDRVLMVAEPGEKPCWDIPGQYGLMLVRESAISLVVTETIDEPAPAA